MADGPFAETKEIISGWAILNADSKAEAIRIATGFMDLHRKHWPDSRASPKCGRCSSPARVHRVATGRYRRWTAVLT
jgi:hypothetical protein